MLFIIIAIVIATRPYIWSRFEYHHKLYWDDFWEVDWSVKVIGNIHQNKGLLDGSD